MIMMLSSLMPLFASLSLSFLIITITVTIIIIINENVDKNGEENNLGNDLRKYRNVRCLQGKGHHLTFRKVTTIYIDNQKRIKIKSKTNRIKRQLCNNRNTETTIIEGWGEGGGVMS